MARLYELAAGYREVEARLAQATEAIANGEEGAEEMAQVWKDTLEAVEGTIEQKLVNIAKLAREKKAEAEVIKAEKQRIERRQRAAENAEAQLRQYMAWAMGEMNIAKAGDEIISVSLGQAKEKVRIASPEALKDIPEVWKPYKWDESNIDKAAVKSFLDKGQELPGIEIVSERTLTIR